MTDKTDPGTVDAWALLYLHDWDPLRDDGSQPVYPEISRVYWSMQEAEAARKAKLSPEKYWVRRAHIAAQSQPAATVQEGDNCERCQGNGEIVTDWDRYLHEHVGDQGDEAVAECPDCNGTGHVDLLPSTERMRNALEMIAHHADGSPKGWAASTALAALTAEPAAKAGDAILRKAQEIVAIANSYQGSPGEHDGKCQIDVLRAAAMIVNGEALKSSLPINPPAPQPDMGSEEALRLAKEALDLAHPYVADAVKADGGIEQCDIAYRMGLEKVEAASAALSTLPHKEEATSATTERGRG